MKNRLISKKHFLLLMFITTFNFAFTQSETEVLRLQVGLGVNSPLGADIAPQFDAKIVNLPSVQFGLRYMFKRNLGAKLDIHYNRFSSTGTDRTFKLNYTRVNLEGVYNVSDKLKFLSARSSLMVHLGPGISVSKPLGIYSANNATFLNLNVGVAYEYALSKRVSLFSDFNYTHSFATKDAYDVLTDGYSFNGAMIQVSIGVSVALSGCKYCEE